MIVFAIAKYILFITIGISINDERTFFRTSNIKSQSICLTRRYRNRLPNSNLIFGITFNTSIINIICCQNRNSFVMTPFLQPVFEISV